MNVRDFAYLLGGAVEGDDSIEIQGLSGITAAGSGDLTFAIDEEKLTNAEKSAAACVLISTHARRSAKTAIRVTNPKLSFIVAYNILNAPKGKASFKHPTAIVSETAKLGKGVWLGPNAIIEEGVVVGDGVIVEDNSVIKKNCTVGLGCHIYPHVTLYENTELQKRVIAHSGAVIGSDGFGYVRDKGVIYKFPQLGRVIIGDDVEIGANTTIDRGSLSDTVIGPGTKIDNLCQIAHNVKIGRNAVIAAQCGISGSVVIGDNVTMGGQAGIVDNVSIGDNVMIGAKSAVIGDVASGSIVWGIPARPISQTKRQMAVLSWITKNFKNISKSIKHNVV